MPIIKEERLTTTSYKPDAFDFKGIKEEVVDGMQFDWKRDKVDDAKKRAIYSSHNYDDFKQRVAGCTLKPIHKDEFNAPPKYFFNRRGGETGGYAGAAAAAAALAGVEGGAKAAEGGERLRRSERKLPRTGHEFEREMRRCAGAGEIVALLRCLDEDACAKLWGRDLDAEVLRASMVALDEAREPGVARQFLANLTACCPTSVARASSFFGAEERQLAARLLARDRFAASHSGGAKEDVGICAALGVPPSLVAAAMAEAQAEAEPKPPEARLAAAVVPAVGPAAVLAARLAAEVASHGDIGELD